VTTLEDRRRLLAIARGSIAAHVRRERPREPDLAGAAARPGGAFVSLHVDALLRGCIGHVEPDDLLGRVIARCALAAATSDPRFPPLTSPEFDRVRIELSLLGPLERIASAADVAVGRHGLVVERGRRRGLLLPQVGAEYGWDAETFLMQTCHKAGLSADAWRAGAALWRFEAEVFGDDA
jgi:AmmeMemoRadiSam system protein A